MLAQLGWAPTLSWGGKGGLAVLTMTMYESLSLTLAILSARAVLWPPGTLGRYGGKGMYCFPRSAPLGE